MKHFLIEICYTVPPEEMPEVIAEHRQFLQSGYESKLLLFSGPFLPKTGGIVVARANSKKEVEDFFQKDPYLIHGKATYRFLEFDPVKHQGFMEEWFASEN